jgi:hypothetical protein
LQQDGYRSRKKEIKKIWTTWKWKKYIDIVKNKNKIKKIMRRIK